MKKIFALAVCLIMCVTSVSVSAARNPYNEMDCINLYNGTIQEYAENNGMSVDEFKAVYGLPEDMPADTNEDIAWKYIPIKNLADVTDTPLDEVISYYQEGYIGSDEITGDSLLMNVENNVKLSHMFPETTLEEIKSMFGLDDSVNGDTPYLDIELKVKRSLLASSDVLSYDDGNQILVMVKGKYIDFDVAPVIDNNRVLVPMRNIFTALGAEVSWQGDVQTVIAVRDDVSIAMQLGQNVLYKNGEKIEIPAASVAKDGRILVPIRAVSEALDTDVYYNSNTKTVVIH